jgi:hypothetical protein
VLDYFSLAFHSGKEFSDEGGKRFCLVDDFIGTVIRDRRIRRKGD